MYGTPCTNVRTTLYAPRYARLVSPAETAVREARDRLRLAHRNLVRAIRALDDPEARYRRSSEASEMLLKMRGVMANLRTRSVGELWEREQLSLAKLAERLGVSKARADEMIRAYKQSRRAE